MRNYYTLVQKFDVEGNDCNRDLTDFLYSNNIEYKISADTAADLREFGLNDNALDGREFYKIYTVLIDEYELSAIQLSVGGVTLIRNRSSVELLNKVRGVFSWFLR